MFRLNFSNSGSNQGYIGLYFESSAIIEKLQEKIDPYHLRPAQINSHALPIQKNLHCTILQNIHKNISKEVISTLCAAYIDGLYAAQYRLHNLSLFENLEGTGANGIPFHYDVLKFDLDAPIVLDLHQTLALRLKDYHNHPFAFENYHPHVTIAFVKPNSCGSLLEDYKDLEINLRAKSLKYKSK
ncbi:MAG: hypothetical protein ACPIAB_06210, partial [Flavobacteriaceae bacterium]